MISVLDRAKLRACLRYWGKAEPKGGPVAAHPLVFHSLDVAACASIYLERHPTLLAQFAVWFGLGIESARGVLIFLLAVHDIGKFAENFQNRVPELVADHFETVLASSNSRLRHDTVASCFLSWLFAENRLPARMRGWNNEVWRSLLTASFGHHGTPPATTNSDIAELKRAMYDASREDALGFFSWCADRFLPDRVTTCDEDRVQLASWWVAGLAVLTDWVGSNTAWFPYARNPERELSLNEYWERVALPQARDAIEKAGIAPEPVRPYTSPEALLRGLQGVPLRPAQKLAATLPIAGEPQLLFLEDATGSGKTEASLILASRLIDAGLADGMYFGLPTQATADQMFERVDLNLSAWFDDPHRATIVLAHGARDQVHAFAAKLDGARDAVNGESDTASLRVTQWLAQSNKRALQAQIGIGTLDQALMSVLRVKHQSLRVLGLFRKVLLVDEVHSYDPYMAQALCETLRLHAAAGGSAILLSATMSLALRQRLLNAYAEGIDLWKPEQRTGRRPARKPPVSARSMDYPLLTRWHSSLGAQPEERTFPAAPHSYRTLDIDYLSDHDKVMAHLDRWVAERQSVVWVRNTVGDACAAYDELVERFGADRVTLFHSRFAAIDRQRIQRDVLRMLGKRSDASVRTGRIVVSTQVLQESLDVDADQMISDLAFVDVMLQRFGRYRRHVRDARGNPLPAAAGQCDGREPGAVVIYGPDRAGEPDASWYRRFSRGAAMVYRAHGKLFLSARAVGESIELPRQFRTLIEEVHGDLGEPVPVALSHAESRDDGESAAQRAHAKLNVISLPNGYRGEDWSDDERIGTRLGDSIEATLVRLEGDILVPWARGRSRADEDEWALSAMRLPGWWLGASPRSDTPCADPRLAACVEQLKMERCALKYRLVLPFVRDQQGGWRCTLAGDSALRLSYREDRGLHRDA